ncbi:MAG: DUF6777 domain-containing protein [Ilumatobacteraceae bacterium]
MDVVTCHQCGNQLSEGVLQCPACGAVAGTSLPPPHPDAPPPPPPMAEVPAAPTQPYPTVPPPTSAPPSMPVVGVQNGQASAQRRGAMIAIGAAVVLLLGGLFVMLRKDDKAASPSTTAGEIFLEPATATGTDPFTSSVDTNTAPPPVRIAAPATNAVATSTIATTATTPLATVAPTTVAATAAPTTIAPTTATTTAATTNGGAPPQGIRSVNATAPGLYGGTRNNSACDAEQMIAYLTATPEKAAAWAGVQGIAVADIPTYIRSLTPFVLRADTRVTNYGFKNGRAVAKQTVLQMGTAVFVDQYGIPRARCSCGNPLSPPIAQPAGTRWVGDPWPGFDPTTVIVVVNVTNVVINDFVVVDLNGGYFGRTPPKSSPTGIPTDGEIYVDSLCDMFPEAPECLPPAPVTLPPETLPPETLPPETTLPEPVLGTGDIQFTLRWSSTADLDLAVLDPLGEEINYSIRSSSSGGQLDVDSNAGCTGAVTNPVENIFWPTGMSPDGVYTVGVSYYAECGSGTGPQSFTLTALIDGVPVELQPVAAAFYSDGTLNAAGERQAYTVNKAPGPPLTVAPTVPPTAPPTAPPTVPATTPTATNRVPVSSVAPVGPTPTTVAAGQPISLEEYCAAKYPPPVADATNMWYTLCMHDPTVNTA